MSKFPFVKEIPDVLCTAEARVHEAPVFVQPACGLQAIKNGCLLMTNRFCNVVAPNRLLT